MIKSSTTIIMPNEVHLTSLYDNRAIECLWDKWSDKAEKEVKTSLEMNFEYNVYESGRLSFILLSALCLDDIPMCLDMYLTFFIQEIIQPNTYTDLYFAVNGGKNYIIRISNEQIQFGKKTVEIFAEEITAENYTEKHPFSKLYRQFSVK